MSGTGIAGLIAKILAKTATAITERSRTTALRATRAENRNCLHIVVADTWDFGEPDFYNLSGGVDVDLTVGTLFSARDHLHYHPDPRFAPNSIVEYLCRTTWAPGGADMQNERFSVRNAAEIGYDGYYWRGISRDRGGGFEELGYCPVCSSLPWRRSA